MRIVSEVPEGSGRVVGCGDAVAEAMHKRITEKRKRGAPATVLRLCHVYVTLKLSTPAVC